MASLFLPAQENRDESVGRKVAPSSLTHCSGVATVVSFGDPVAADFAAASAPCRLADLSQRDAIVRLQTAFGTAHRADVVLFLPRRLRPKERLVLDALIALVKKQGTAFIGIVSTFRVHLGDAAAAQIEAYALDSLKDIRARVALFRPGHVMSDHSAATVNLRRFGFLAPLVPSRVRSCCVRGAELFAAMDQARQGTAHRRTYTMLGPNRPWKEHLREHRRVSLVQTCLSLACFVGCRSFRLSDRSRPSFSICSRAGAPHCGIGTLIRCNQARFRNCSHSTIHSIFSTSKSLATTTASSTSATTIRARPDIVSTDAAIQPQSPPGVRAAASSRQTAAPRFARQRTSSQPPTKNSTCFPTTPTFVSARRSSCRSTAPRRITLPSPRPSRGCCFTIL